MVIYVLDAETIRKSESAITERMTKEEKEYVQKIKNGHVKLLSLGSAYLKSLLPNREKMTKNEQGKPLIEGVCFNITHAYPYVMMTVSDSNRDIGIDIETERECREDVVRYCLSREERERMEENDIDFLTLYTAKESLGKAEGSGLYFGVSKVPAFPVNGHVSFRNRHFVRQDVPYDGCRLSVTQSAEGFEEMEDIVFCVLTPERIIGAAQ